jgi:hypothetical protein
MMILFAFLARYSMITKDAKVVDGDGLSSISHVENRGLVELFLTRRRSC